MNFTEKAIKKIDWEQLREQKMSILKIIMNKDNRPYFPAVYIESLEGVANMISAIQDAAYLDGVASEEDIYGTCSDE